jgi:hypothetical protein
MRCSERRRPCIAQEGVDRSGRRSNLVDRLCVVSSDRRTAGDEHATGLIDSIRTKPTFHNSAANVLEHFWEQHRLPRFEMTPDNDAATVLRGLTSDEQAADVLKVYLESKRLKPAEDDLLPFDASAIGVLLNVSEGRVGILLAMAHGLVQAAANAGIPVIDADFALSHFSGTGVDVDIDGGDVDPSPVSDLDDLLQGEAPANPTCSRIVRSGHLGRAHRRPADSHLS